MIDVFHEYMGYFLKVCYIDEISNFFKNVPHLYLARKFKN